MTLVATNVTRQINRLADSEGKVIACLASYALKNDCVLSRVELERRLKEHGLGKYMPHKRNDADALRLAFSKIAAESIRDTENGGTEELVIEYISRDSGESNVSEQYWSFHRKVTDKKGKSREYPVLGNAKLVTTYTKNEAGETVTNGELTIPEGTVDMERVLEEQRWFVENNDHTKLRTCLGDIMKSIAQIPLDIGGWNIVNATTKQYIDEHVAPIFDNLDDGVAIISVIEIANTTATVATVKKDMERTLGQTLGVLKAGIVKVKAANTSVTKGQVTAWMQQIMNIQKNMDMINALGIVLPHSIEGLENEIEELSAGAKGKEGPRKKTRAINIMPLELADE